MTSPSYSWGHIFCPWLPHWSQWRGFDKTEWNGTRSDKSAWYFYSPVYIVSSICKDLDSTSIVSKNQLFKPINCSYIKLCLSWCSMSCPNQQFFCNVGRFGTLKLFLLFLIQSIIYVCRYSKELSWSDGSFEHPKQMLKLMDKKIITILH